MYIPVVIFKDEGSVYGINVPDIQGVQEYCLVDCLGSSLDFAVWRAGIRFTNWTGTDA